LLNDCLSREWRSALGTNGNDPLVWRLVALGPKNTEGKTTIVPFPTWQQVMHELARIKIAVRTADFFSFRQHGGGRNGHPQPLPRHLLAYPSGSNHKVDAAGWKDQGRMANQVIFKVHRWKSGYAGTIAHFPARVPAHMAQRLQLPDPTQLWQEVHRLLDAEKGRGLLRIKGGQA
jgi:CRISPR-associated protein Cmr1